jgi:hypothetical protein
MEQPIPGNNATVEIIVKNPSFLSENHRQTDARFPSRLELIAPSLFTLFFGLPPLNLYHKTETGTGELGNWVLGTESPETLFPLHSDT